jgi:hypothetical protein
MYTRGVFLDIKGAFGAVPHYLLIHKLKSYGICGNLIKLLGSYLTSRRVKS